MKTCKSFSSIVLLCLAASALPLAAQVPTPSPASVALNTPTLSTTAVTQTITITGTPGESWQIQAVGGFWLRFTVNPTCPGSVNACGTTNSGTTSVTIIADPSGLPAYLYTGSLSISYPGGVVTIPVSMNVGGSSSAITLAAAPSALTFTGAPLSGSQSQVVAISSAGTSNTVFFNASSNVPWLTTNLDTGATFAPSNVTVTANPSTLTAGTYQGILTFTPTGGGTPVNVAVTLNLGVSQQLVANPTAVTFSALPGGAGLAPVSVALGVNSGSNVPYTASISYPGLAAMSWLALSTTSGQTGTSLILSAPGGTTLPIGSYAATVTIASPGLNPVYLPVTLNISSTAQFVVNVNPIAFTVQPASTTSRTFTLSSTSGAGIGYTVTPQYISPQNPAVNWISLLSAVGNTPASVTVTATPGSLPAGTYTANLIITSNSAGYTPLSIPVSMTVATGQSVTHSPASLNFSYLGSGAISSVQNIQLGLNPTSPSPAATVTATPDVAGQNWLSAVLLSTTPGLITAGSQVAVSVNAAGLPNGTYTGKVLIATPSAANPQIQIPVTLTVSGVPTGTTPSIVFSSYQFSFSAATNGTPPDQTVTVSTNTGAAIPYTLTANAPWITLLNNTGTTPGSTTIRVSAAGLAVGLYSGTLTLSAPGASNNGTTIPITLTVGTSNQTLLLSPTSLSFVAQVNGTPPPSQSVAVSSSTGAATPYTVTSNQGWLQGIAATDNTPGNVAVYVNPVGLAAGTYTGTLTVFSSGFTSTVPVTLEVTSGPLLRLSQQSVTFNHQTGQALPAPQTILVTSSTGAAVAAGVSVTTASGGNWLAATPATVQTPGAFALSLVGNVVATLAPGTYTGTVTVGAPGTSALTSAISVTLNISNSGLLTMSTAPISFNAQTLGNSPAPRTRQITSTGSALNLTVSASTNLGSSWLTATLNSSVTPATLTITASPGGLAAGTYSGSVTVSGGTSGTVAIGANSLVIPVTLNVTAQAALNVDRSELLFSGSTLTAPQSIQVSSTSITLGYTVATSVSNSSTNWLNASAVSGVTPSAVSITTNPSALADGTYFGAVTITPQGGGGSPLVIPVTLILNRGTALQVTPATLNFTQIRGSVLAASQLVQVTSQQSVAFSFNAAVQSPVGGNWLNVAQFGSLTNGSLQVALNNAATSLPLGSYTASITVFEPNTSASIPITVNLTVVSANNLVATPNAITFNGRLGQANPPAQTLQVTSTVAGLPLSFNVTSSVPWLSATPLSGTTPANLSITANTSALPAGTTIASGNLTLVPLVGGNPVTINVTFIVDPSPAPLLTTFANAATFQPGSLSPGMIFTIVGTNLGPAQAVPGQLVNGRFTSSVAGVRVLMDGIPAPIIYASATQINAIVPYVLGGRAFTQLSVEYNNVASNSLAPRVVDTAPGIFTTDGRQAAALNSDGTVNSAANPAAAGSIVVLYVTGEGQVTPAGVDGEAVPATNLRKPVAPVRVRLNGVEIAAEDIVYAGSAPTLVSGLMQINFKLPPNTPANAATPVEVSVGAGQSPTGTTIAVRQ